MPNSGIVLPQTEIISFLRAAAMCINPVSFAIILYACFTSDADWFMLNCPHALKILSPTDSFIISAFSWSSFPPNKTMG